MGASESWERRWSWCSRCGGITPQIPYLQNWGKASPKCEICGDSNVFVDYDKILTTERRYINARKATTPRKKKQEQDSP